MLEKKCQGLLKVVIPSEVNSSVILNEVKDLRKLDSSAPAALQNDEPIRHPESAAGVSVHLEACDAHTSSS
jgi:hypothetical protein